MHTNITGTLTLLEEAVAAGVSRFVFTSTTSAFGRALVPAPGAPAAWIDEDVRPVPRNVYGATKVAAEDLCELVHRDHGLPVLILRTSRFFPEGDDRDDVRSAYDDLNLKVNELLYRRVDLEDVVSAHRLALERAPRAGLRPLHHQRDHAVAARGLRAAARRCARRGAALGPGIRGRSTSSAAGACSTASSASTTAAAPVPSSAGRRATTSPAAIDALAAGEDPRSELARAVGTKGYHAGVDRPLHAAGLIHSPTSADIGAWLLRLRPRAAAPAAEQLRLRRRAGARGPAS